MARCCCHKIYTHVVLGLGDGIHFSTASYGGFLFAGWREHENLLCMNLSVTLDFLFIHQPSWQTKYVTWGCVGRERIRGVASKWVRGGFSDGNNRFKSERLLCAFWECKLNALSGEFFFHS